MTRSRFPACAAQCLCVVTGAEGADCGPKPLRFLAATVQV